MPKLLRLVYFAIFQLTKTSWLKSAGLGLLTLAFILGLNLIPPSYSQTAPTQTAETTTLVKEGIQKYQRGEYLNAIAILNQALKAIPSSQLHNYLAQSYRQIGQLNAAITHWEAAIQGYRRSGQTRELGQTISQQAQAYNQLGQNRKAIQLLQAAPDTQDPIAKLMVQGALGNAYRGLGDYEQALSAHENALKLAQESQRPHYLVTSLNNLGNVYIARAQRYTYQAQVAKSEQDATEQARLEQLTREDQSAAIQTYRQSLQVSQTIGGIVPIQALLNLNRSLAKQENPPQEEIKQNYQQALTLLEPLPPSRDKAYALINIATNHTEQNREILAEALTIAKTIGDHRAESFALGALGEIFETAQQYDQAMGWTEQAQFAAQQAFAADSLYRWQWQSGRLLEAQGRTEAAIKAYESAIATLQTIRSDILAANQELQFDFRDSVEPIYRGLISLLVQEAVASSQTKAINTKATLNPLQEVLDTLELLKLAELENFFGDECVQVAKAISENSPQANFGATVIYSVVLEDQVAMIVQLPDQSLNIYPLAIAESDLQREIDQLRFVLEDQATEAYIPQSQKVYDLLIRPLEADLAQSETLVFVQDGVLRKVPMSALYDGEKFLVEKHAIANTPSLSLTDYRPTQRNFNVLALGLTLERPPFAPLFNVQAEVDKVANILGGTKLVDENFTLSQLESQLGKQNYSVIHMATHGKFGVDANSTFLLAYDQRIRIDELDRVLRSRQGTTPIELLTMSACQTAAGDNRSALGIAGVAVRAGVKTALASLWYISDEATVPLIEEFYTQLNQPGVNKAEALRKAQIKLIHDPYYGHPAMWSPLVLIGNWA